MSEDFKPGTRPLLRLAGLEADRPFVSRDDENHAIWTAASVLLMRCYLQPDPETRRENGPADAQVLAGLRAALPEHFGDEAAGYIAWALIYYGCRQKPTLASLHPWERLMFEWQERRGSAPRIALMLRQASLDATLPPPTLEAIDRWINQPATALGNATAIMTSLFGTRLVVRDLANDDAEHGASELFRDLVASLSTPLPVAAARLRIAADRQGTRWIVEVDLHDGRVQGFEAVPRGQSMDADSVAAALDTLMEKIGRPERVFRLEPGRERGGGLATFIVVDGRRFAELAWRLRLPVVRSPKALEAIINAATPEAAAAASAAAGGRPARPAEAPAATTGAPAAPVTAPSAPSAPEPQFATSMLTTSGETQPALDSNFAPMFVPDMESDSAMRSLITSLRRGFGTNRMLSASKMVTQSRVSAPAWIAESGDALAAFYGQQVLLLRKGRIIWGALVRAPEALLARGDVDLPGVLVYSIDAHFDGRPEELRSIGSRLASLKTTSDNPALRAIAEQLRDENARPFDVKVPEALTTREVLMTSFVGVRSHLPSNRLGADWFPMLSHPDSPIPMLVPCGYWPQALRTAWDSGKLRGRIK
jgi:hypothetical protein